MHRGTNQILGEQEIKAIEKYVNGIDLTSLDESGRRWALRCRSLAQEIRRLRSILETSETDTRDSDGHADDTVVL